MGRHFPVREKSGNFEQTGKVRENHTKYWKTEINWDKYYLIFLVIFKWTVHFLVKWIKFSVKKTKQLKNTGKMAKNTGKVREKSGNFVSLEKWEPCLCLGGSLSGVGGLCPGRGSLSMGVPVRETLMIKSGWYASYWNTFLFFLKKILQLCLWYNYTIYAAVCLVTEKARFNSI